MTFSPPTPSAAPHLPERSGTTGPMSSRGALPPPRAWVIGYWSFQFLFWGAYVAIGLLTTLPRTGFLPSVIGGYALFFFYSIAVSHGLRVWAHRRAWLDRSPGPAALRFFGGVLALGTVLAGLVALVQGLWTGFAGLSTNVSLYLFVWSSTTTSSLLWVAAYVGAASLLRVRLARENALRLELDMREAKLKALEAQIGPHFLFNCLNTLRGLIVENPAAAQDIVTRLANILRHNLSRETRATEPLREQIEITTDYLTLESLRFEERLRTRFDVAPEVLDVAVPAMLLQTLVENAVKHGISQLPDGGDIAVSARAQGDGTLEIVVENSGSLRASPKESTRIGLRNLRERLRVLHGERAALTLEDSGNGRVTAKAIVPLARGSTP